MSEVNFFRIEFLKGFSYRSEEYHGIGVRLEDTITITRKGAECLTDLAPREVDQIEEIIALSAT